MLDVLLDAYSDQKIRCKLVGMDMVEHWQELLTFFIRRADDEDKQSEIGITWPLLICAEIGLKPVATKRGGYIVRNWTKNGTYSNVTPIQHQGIDCVKKELKEEQFTEKNLARFQREYEILKSISHPNIIRVYEIEGASYIMEKADCDLEEYVLKMSFQMKKLTELSMELLRASRACMNMRIRSFIGI